MKTHAEGVAESMFGVIDSYCLKRRGLTIETQSIPKRPSDLFPSNKRKYLA